jgi:2-methylisocitrate lyase-like PEP mutase family enzyme
VDALTTDVVERAGFGALSFAGAGFSYTRLGSPDVGFATLGEVAWRVGSVVRAMGLPVLVEGDGGPSYVMRTVRLLEAAGAAAVHLEGQARGSVAATEPGTRSSRPT